MPREKTKTVYVCSSCGETSPRWLGRCPSCGEWNTMTEDVVRETKSRGFSAPSASSSGVRITASRLKDISTTEEKSRIVTGISELDRVLGGGIVLGSVVLLGGEPGAGKSTLLLQLCGAISRQVDVLYITGEESTRQIKLRAVRLNVDEENIMLAAETDIGAICDLIEQTKPGLVVIDSIQTMNCAEISSSTGSVSQVKECAARLLIVAKTWEIPTFIVGHVNKDGAIAGPKVMEHIVDTVLYFEGDKMLPYRVLRAAKNRYGSTNEIGMFDMTGSGLKVIENPSQLLLEGRPIGVSGNCVACTMEGTRPILSEIQALVTKTSFGTPRRASSGFDFNRTNLLLAVLEKRAGYFLGNLDVYINIVGGLRLDETACDLSVCLAVVSSLMDKPVPDDLIAIGEVGLGGEVRSVTNLEYRLKEAMRMGFVRAVIPKHSLNQLDPKEFDRMELLGVSYVRQAIGLL
ncbi:MAG: DNA repair protein RadA [Subdoligranulum sp.]|nr:DNA repair protein RadA [Subdoligranulum sp.]